MNLLAELFLRSTQRNLSDIFLTDTRSDKDFLYQNLSDSAACFQKILVDKKVAKGDRVIFVTKNSRLFYPLFFACAAQGAVLVPMNPELHDSEAKAIINDSRPRAIFYDTAEIIETELIQAFSPEVSGKLRGLDSMLPGKPDDKRCKLKVVECESDEPALIIYTSGTSGNCKGVVLTHKNLRSMAETFGSFYGYKPGQRFLSVLPFYHINAPMITGLACIAGGSRIFLTDLFGVTTAKFFWEIIEEHKINVLSITPSIMKVLLALFPHGPDARIDSVSFALVGTAFLPESLWRSFEEKFKIPCYQGYGLTETTTWAVMTPPDERKKYNTAGMPVNCEVKIEPVRIRMQDSQGVNTGEVLIKGDIIMSGYNNNPGFTRQQMADGWLKTGDLGYFDPDGQLVIAGRIKNIIKRKGVLIFPEEIDQLLMKHSSVSECYTIGVEDDFKETLIISACVVKGNNEDLEKDLRGYVLAGTSSYKCPNKFFFLNKLPKNSVGKVMIGKLADIVTGEKAREIMAKLNTYKISRAHLTDKKGIFEIIQNAIVNNSNFYFVGYWGAGHRSAAINHDIKALDRLKMIADFINEFFDTPLAGITLILADVHARCNLIPEASINAYFSAIKAEMVPRGLNPVLLSSIWEKYGLDYSEAIDRAGESEFLEKWNNFSLKEEFITQASKLAPLPAIAEDYAKRYYSVVMMERQAVTDFLKNAIFFTYNDPKFRIVLPELPMLYLHSIKPGTGKKPWFMPMANDQAEKE
jgi:acyl-CoA synthetase (AMP-forming)/AMP-acid ligase II